MVWPYNGAALSYIPIELGWRFESGLRLRLGMEAFYYEGPAEDPDTGTVTTYTYQMLDLRVSALYVWPWPFQLRPLAGFTVETVGLDSNRVATDTSLPQEQQGAPSFVAPGAELGLEYRGGPGWAVSLEARVVYGFSTQAHLEGTDLGWHYLF
jgi:hypothetical protein